MRNCKFLILFLLLSLIMAGSLHAAEYVAFSMKVAQERILSIPQGKDFRKVHPEVFTLGGITKIRGLVYDRKNEDVILVGERDVERSILTLDDFVVALRARFIHGKWPLVSIDPTPETEKTNMQRVRFEGGIEDTQFGQDLFDADYRLKRIGMGIVSPGVQGLKTYWDISMERAKESPSSSRKIYSRFWFYPMLPSVSVRQDVVAIRGLKVGVFTEVLSAQIAGKKIEELSTFQDAAGDTFARELSDNFEKLAKVHPSFLRLHGLSQFVALTRAIEVMDDKPDLSFWLKDYREKKVETERELKVLSREEEYEAPIEGSTYLGYYKVSGGVELFAIALRLKAWDITALRETVLRTRTKKNELIWSFIIKDWGVVRATDGTDANGLAELVAHGLFLYDKKRYDDAVSTFSKVISINPSLPEIYNYRGNAYRHIGKYDYAIEDHKQAIATKSNDAIYYNNLGVDYAAKNQYGQALKSFNIAVRINPSYAKAYVNRGTVYGKKGDYDQAMRDINRAISINPNLAMAYNDRGCVYFEKGNYSQALGDFSKSLCINPNLEMAYYNQGRCYVNIGKYNLAIKSFNYAIAIDPNNWKNHLERGSAHLTIGNYDQAKEDFNYVILISPQTSGEYTDRGMAFFGMGNYDKAIRDFTQGIKIDPDNIRAHILRSSAYSLQGNNKKSIEDLNYAIPRNPNLAEAYINRGNIYHANGDYKRAVKDFDTAISLNPHLPEAYYNRGNAYYEEGKYKQAIFDYTRATEINPRYLNAYLNRGNCYAHKEEYDLAIADFAKAIGINPGNADARFNRGRIYIIKGQYSQAISDFNKVLELNPKDGPAYFFKASACEKAGYFNEAAEAFKSFIKYAPPQSDDQIEYARQRIKALQDN